MYNSFEVQSKMQISNFEHISITYAVIGYMNKNENGVQDYCTSEKSSNSTWSDLKSTVWTAA